MKQVKSFLKIFSLGLLLVGGAACTGNFDEINRKEYEVTKDEQGRENYNIGSTLRGLQGLVVPTKEHLYQFIEALAAGPFAGYYGTTLVRTDKFETYNPSVDWQDKTYGDIFTESYPLYRDLQDQSDDPVALALAKLLRACDIVLTAEEMAELEKAVAAIPVVGSRYDALQESKIQK